MRPWAAHPAPIAAELVAGELGGALRAGIELVAGRSRRSPIPSARLRKAREVAEGLGELVWAGLDPAPATPLNVEIGPHRRFVGVPCRLGDFQLVKRTFGGTVNDVVLAVATGAIRELLLSRGVRTEGLELRALVPVSTRPRTTGKPRQLAHGDARPAARLHRGPAARLEFDQQEMRG